MRYNKTEKIDIGRQVYTHEIGRVEAAAKYGLCMTTIENYIKEYKQMACRQPVPQVIQQ